MGSLKRGGLSSKWSLIRKSGLKRGVGFHPSGLSKKRGGLSSKSSLIRKSGLKTGTSFHPSGLSKIRDGLSSEWSLIRSSTVSFQENRPLLQGKQTDNNNINLRHMPWVRYYPHIHPKIHNSFTS